VSIRYRRNPRLKEEGQRDPQVRRALRQYAEDIAETAEDIGRLHSSSYVADVSTRGDRVTIEVRTSTAQGVRSIAGWLEFGGESAEGTVPMLRPLGRAAEEHGAKLRGRG
jgi:hypothetical protein